MKGSIEITIPDLQLIDQKLDVIISMLKTSAEKEDIMTKELITLQADVAENTVLDASIITLCDGLSAQILSLKDDPAALAALSASLKASSAAIAAAVLANTPVVPPEEPTV